LYDAFFSLSATTIFSKLIEPEQTQYNNKLSHALFNPNRRAVFTVSWPLCLTGELGQKSCF